MGQIKTDKKKLLLWCLFSAGLAGIIFLILSAINGISPLGANTVLRNDALHQYAPFLANYVQRIKAGSSVLYSWDVGAGVNQFALIAYYLLSPFNLLALPFNSSNIDTAFWLIIFVKTMCIAAASYYFFSKKNGENGFLPIVFSLAYTFGGFYICYYYNTMWLDALIMLPLIALGIENIVNGKKATLYFCSLAYAILVNFYLGYMICIFSVLYFFYLLFAKDVSKNKAEKAEDELPISVVLLKYGFASLLAGMAAAVVILPVYFAINYGTNKSDFDTVNMLFNFFDFLSYHLTGSTPLPLEKTTGTAPYVMSSMLTFLTVPAFFFLKNIKPNKKIASLVVVAIFYFSFAVPKMNYFWHGFSAPANLPYRFTFIYILFILTLAFEVVKNIKELPVWAFGVSGVLIVTGLVYTHFSQFADRFDTKTIAVSSVCAAVYLTLLLLYKYDKLNARVIAPLLAVTIMAEVVVGNYQNYVSIEDKTQFYPYADTIEKVKEYITENNSDYLNRFEIVEKEKGVQNYPALYNYNGISTFSSLSDGDFSGTQKMLGNYGNFGNSYLYTVQSPIYNAMFDVKYVYDTDGMIDEDDAYYEKVAEIDGGVLYKVKYTLPIGYCIREDIKAWSPYSYLSTSVQSLLWLCSTGVDGAMDYTKPDNINYTNCYAVSADEISQYIVDNATEENSQYDEENIDHDHDHEHDHEDDDYKSELFDYDNASTYEFDLSAENISQLTELIGDVYSLKATSDGFYATFDFTAKEQGEIMALVYSGSFKTLKLIRADGSEKTFDIDERHITDLGYFEKGEKYQLVVCDPDRPFEEYDPDYPLSDSIQMSVATVNEEKFLEGYNQILKNGTLKIDEFDDTYIHGTVNSTIDGYMMMPMPYDEGWTVYVDGEQVELHEHESHIMMYEITKGEHEIEMKYFPLGLKEGIFVSLAAVLGLALVLLLGRVHKMKLAFEAEEAAKAAESENSDAESKNEAGKE